MPRKIVPPEMRFWRRVQKTDSCWVWTGCLNNHGYGEFWAGPEQGYQFTHRFSWLLHFGPIPKDLKVLHHCDNPPCIRPDHLFLGTMLDNARDSISKGRYHHFGGFKGEEHPRAKLTYERVAFIRSSNLSLAALSVMFGVARQVIWNAKKGNTWKSIPSC